MTDKAGMTALHFAVSCQNVSRAKYTNYTNKLYLHKKITFKYTTHKPLIEMKPN